MIYCHMLTLLEWICSIENGCCAVFVITALKVWLCCAPIAGAVAVPSSLFNLLEGASLRYMRSRVCQQRCSTPLSFPMMQTESVNQRSQNRASADQLSVLL
jgi:hypothetical protein